jgi:hypothetical protein
MQLTLNRTSCHKRNGGVRALQLMPSPPAETKTVAVGMAVAVAALLFRWAMPALTTPRRRRTWL